MNGQNVLIAIGAVGGLTGLASMVDVFFRRKKTIAEEEKLKAESEKLGIDGAVSLSDQALEMYKLAREEAQEAKLSAEYCRQRLDALEDHVRALKKQLRRHDIEPPPFEFPAFPTWRASRAS